MRRRSVAASLAIGLTIASLLPARSLGAKSPETKRPERPATAGWGPVSRCLFVPTDLVAPDEIGIVCGLSAPPTLPGYAIVVIE